MGKLNKVEIDRIRSTTEYLKLVEDCKDFQRKGSTKGQIIGFLKQQDQQLLLVLSKDVKNIKLLAWARAALKEQQADKLNSSPKSVNPLSHEEVQKLVTESKQNNERKAESQQSLKGLIQFNVKVLLPAVVVLKKSENGDPKSLIAFLKKQDLESLDKLRKIEPKVGLISDAMAKELRSRAVDVIIDNMKQLAEKHHGLHETPGRQTEKERKSNTAQLEQYKKKFPGLVEHAYQKLKEGLEQKLIDYKLEENRGTLGADTAVKAVEESLYVVNKAITQFKSEQAPAKK